MVKRFRRLGFDATGVVAAWKAIIRHCDFVDLGLVLELNRFKVDDAETEKLKFNSRILMSFYRIHLKNCCLFYPMSGC